MMLYNGVAVALALGSLSQKVLASSYLFDALSTGREGLNKSIAFEKPVNFDPSVDEFYADNDNSQATLSLDSLSNESNNMADSEESRSAPVAGGSIDENGTSVAGNNSNAASQAVEGRDGNGFSFESVSLLDDAPSQQLGLQPGGTTLENNDGNGFTFEPTSLNNDTPLLPLGAEPGGITLPGSGDGILSIRSDDGTAGVAAEQITTNYIIGNLWVASFFENEERDFIESGDKTTINNGAGEVNTNINYNLNSAINIDDGGNITIVNFLPPEADTVDELTNLIALSNFVTTNVINQEDGVVNVNINSNKNSIIDIDVDNTNVNTADTNESNASDDIMSNSNEVFSNYIVSNVLPADGSGINAYVINNNNGAVNVNINSNINSDVFISINSDTSSTLSAEQITDDGEYDEFIDFINASAINNQDGEVNININNNINSQFHMSVDLDLQQVIDINTSPQSGHNLYVSNLEFGYPFIYEDIQGYLVSFETDNELHLNAYIANDSSRDINVNLYKNIGSEITINQLIDYQSINTPFEFDNFNLSINAYVINSGIGNVNLNVNSNIGSILDFDILGLDLEGQATSEEFAEQFFGSFINIGPEKSVGDVVDTNNSSEILVTIVDGLANDDDGIYWS